jgi:hypothetical protein
MCHDRDAFGQVCVKTPFFTPLQKNFKTKTMLLPRQAWDKHARSAEK